MHFASLALAALPLVAGFADPVVHERARSRSRQHTELTKRQSYSGRATYYAVGLGACGWNNVASDYIVALNTAQYGSGYPGPNCGRSITITANGVSVQATIADQCPSCGYGDLDLSEGLFTRFASTDAGVFQMSWHYNDGNNQQPQPQPTTTTQQAQTTPTTTYTPPTSTYTPPTSTYTPPTTTSTQPAETSTTTAAAVSTTTSAPVVSSAASIIASGITTNGTVLPFAVTSQASASASASADSNSDTQSSTIPSSQMGNLVLFNQAVANLGNIVVVGATQ